MHVESRIPSPQVPFTMARSSSILKMPVLVLSHAERPATSIHGTGFGIT